MARTRHTYSRSAFTLVEVLVVVVIIAILSALVMAGIVAARQMAMRNQSRVEALSIVAAIKAYRNEYGRFPGQTASASDHVIDQGMTNEQSALMDALIDNPRNIAFIDPPTTNAYYVDPWGDNLYVIGMDYDGDGNVTLNITYDSASINTTILNEAAVAISWGRPNETDEHRRTYSWIN